MLITNLSAPITESVENLTVTLGDYANSTDAVKSIHGFVCPYVQVESGASETVFNVGASDISKFFVGASLEVHTEDYANLSDEVRVLSIYENEITVNKSLGFIPDSTYYIDLIGFSGGGPPYRIL